jgi:hypothetical protein
VAKVSNFHPTLRGGTKPPLMEHLLRSSTKLVNLVSRSIKLVDLDLVDLNCLASIWWCGAKNGEFVAIESLPSPMSRASSTDAGFMRHPAAAHCFSVHDWERRRARQHRGPYIHSSSLISHAKELAPYIQLSHAKETWRDSITPKDLAWLNHAKDLANSVG